MSLKHLKERCAGCEREGVDMTKEHVFPKWLLERTNTLQTPITWSVSQGEVRKVSASKATLPLCDSCNNDLGSRLEAPVKLIFEDLEAGKGISDSEAELLVRWLWKISGLFWFAKTPRWDYSEIYTLKQRCLQPIDGIREDLILAVALFADKHPESIDLPIGIDSYTKYDAIFVAGVFSKVAIMVVRDCFEDCIPPQFSKYKLHTHRLAEKDFKVFFPRVSFPDDVLAVVQTVLISHHLSLAHDLLMFWQQTMEEGGQTKDFSSDHICLDTYFFPKARVPLYESYMYSMNARTKKRFMLSTFYQHLVEVETSEPPNTGWLGKMNTTINIKDGWVHSNFSRA